MDDLMVQQKENKEKVQATATEVLNEKRNQHVYELQTWEEVSAYHEKQGADILSRRAELYEMGQVPDMNLNIQMKNEVRQRPASSRLSERKRNKIAQKRANNLKKAQKNNWIGATEDTIPMMEQVKSFHKDIQKHPVELTKKFGFDRNLFSPDFPEEQPCSIDIKKGLMTLEKLKAAHRVYKAGQLNGSDFEQISYKANFVVMERLEEALRTILATNGIDMDTGSPLMDLERIETARMVRAEAVERYELAMDKIRDILGEQAELHFEQELGLLNEQIKRNNAEQRRPETADLDFEFHYEPLEEEYVKLRKSIDSNPDKYAEYKSIIDQSYHRYLDVNTRIAAYGRRIWALKELAKRYFDDKSMRKIIEERASALASCAELDHLQSIAAQQYELIRFLLEGRPFTEELQYMYKVIEEEYGIQTTVREEQKKELEDFNKLPDWQKEEYRKLPAEDQRMALHFSKVVKERSRQRKAVMDANRSRIEKSNKDKRALMLLLHGAQVNEYGAPLKVEDGKNMLEDQYKIEAYLSNDLKRTEPLLAPIVEKVLRYPFLQIDVKKELRERPAEYIDILFQTTYLQNMLHDHPEYYNSLPKETTEELKRVMRIGGWITGYTQTILSVYSVEIDGELSKEPGSFQRRKDALSAMETMLERLRAEETNK